MHHQWKENTEATGISLPLKGSHVSSDGFLGKKILFVTSIFPSESLICLYDSVYLCFKIYVITINDQR